MISLSQFPIDTIHNKHELFFSNNQHPTKSGDNITMRRFLIAIAVLVCAQTTFAQFGNNNSQSNRLIELAGTLSRQANDFADANYRSYSNTFRSNRSDIEAVMLTEQFSG